MLSASGGKVVCWRLCQYHIMRHSIVVRRYKTPWGPFAHQFGLITPHGEWIVYLLSNELVANYVAGAGSLNPPSGYTQSNGALNGPNGHARTQQLCKKDGAEPVKSWWWERERAKNGGTRVSFSSDCYANDKAGISTWRHVSHLHTFWFGHT